MKTNEEIYMERKNRLDTAIALGTPDKVPIILTGDSFFARHLGIPLADYLKDLYESSQIHLRSIPQLGEVDGVQYLNPCIYSLGQGVYANVKLPGRELAPDAQWQIEEVNLMTVDDYDIILNKGFMQFHQEFLAKNLPTALTDMEFHMKTDFPQIIADYKKAGYVPFTPIISGVPFDMLSSNRGMSNLVKDLFRIPDKVLAVIDIVTTDLIEILRAQIRYMKPYTVFIGATRCASEFLSPKLWEKFAFPHLKRIVEAVVGEGCNVLLHFDSNWDRSLEYFREFPKGKCVFASDHSTDIYKARKVLDGYMCVMGDVPAALLKLGTPDEVYQYSHKLIKELGPSGFILAVGCCLPLDAKVENVKAMIAAASGK